MTWLETEEIERRCRDKAKTGSNSEIGQVLAGAAEAIEWLRKELEEAQDTIEYLEEFARW